MHGLCKSDVNTEFYREDASPEAAEPLPVCLELSTEPPPLGSSAVWHSCPVPCSLLSVGTDGTLCSARTEMGVATFNNAVCF